MNTTSDRTSVALFVALTRAVREAAVAEGVRNRTYEIIDRMANSVGLPGFQVELDALAVIATHEPLLLAMLQPLWVDLRALSASSLPRFKRALVQKIDDQCPH